MSYCKITINKNPEDDHYMITAADENGECTKAVAFNKRTVSMSYDIYDYIMNELAGLKSSNVALSDARRKDKDVIHKNIVEKHQLLDELNTCKNDLSDLTDKYKELEENFKEVCDELVAEQEKNTKLRDKFNKLHTSFKGLCSELIDEKEKSRDIGVVRDENKRLRDDIADLRKETIRLTSELNKYQNKSIITQLKELAEKMHAPVITAKQEATYDEPISDSLREDDTITIKSDGDGTLYDIWRNTVLDQHHIGVLRVRFGMVGVFGTYFNRVSEINNIFTVSDLLKWVWSNPGTAYRFSIRRDK